jgi:hypothetical protein
LHLVSFFLLLQHLVKQVGVAGPDIDIDVVSMVNIQSGCIVLLDLKVIQKKMTAIWSLSAVIFQVK